MNQKEVDLMLLRLMTSLFVFICYVGAVQAEQPAAADCSTSELSTEEFTRFLPPDGSWSSLEILGDGAKHALISAAIGAVITGSLGAISRINSDEVFDEGRHAAIYGAVCGALEGLVIAIAARTRKGANVWSNQDLIEGHLRHHVNTNLWHFIGSCLFEDAWNFSSGVKAPALSTFTLLIQIMATK